MRKPEIDPVLVGALKYRADQGALGTRGAETWYLSTCTGYDAKTGARLIFTRDVGMHSCGWWKNPDYERCYHLSISFRYFLSGAFAPFDRGIALEYLKAFFGDDHRKTWSEPPYTREGKVVECWHFRLFCDEHWQPILPRGEVYSKELTEAGYKTFSELKYEREKANVAAGEHA